MATRTQLLHDQSYEDYVLIGLVQAARDVLNESINTEAGDKRKSVAKNVLANPFGYLETFKALIIGDLADAAVTGWDGITEAAKIAGAKAAALNIWNQALNVK